MSARRKEKHLPQLRKLSDLDDHQVLGIGEVTDRRKLCVFLKPGGGKTILALTAAMDAHAMPLLIVAPIRVCETVWREEAAAWEHTRHLDITLLRGTPKRRAELLAAPADVYLINYELLPWLMSETRLVAEDEVARVNTIQSRASSTRRRRLPRRPDRHTDRQFTPHPVR